MGPLDDLGARTRAAGVNGSVPPPGVGMPGHDPNGGGAPAAGAPGAGPQGPQGEQPKPKQAVMRRSFPPVGVLLVQPRTFPDSPTTAPLIFFVPPLLSTAPLAHPLHPLSHRASLAST
eukprot:1031957-Rhodomonas_salina.1